MVVVCGVCPVLRHPLRHNFSLSACRERERAHSTTRTIWKNLHSAAFQRFCACCIRCVVIICYCWQKIYATYCVFLFLSYLLRWLLCSDAFFLSDTHFSFCIYRSSMRIRRADCGTKRARARQADRVRENQQCRIMWFDHTDWHMRRQYKWSWPMSHGKTNERVEKTSKQPKLSCFRMNCLCGRKKKWNLYIIWRCARPSRRRRTRI